LRSASLTGRLAPDHKTIADFRKGNGPAIKKVCAQFVSLCRQMGLLAKASVAIDGSKFKAVNSRDNNFTKGKMERRLAQIEESVARYLSQLDTADRQTAAEAPSEELAARTTRLKERLAKLEEEVKRLKAIEKEMLAAPDQQISFTDPDSRSMATSERGSGKVGYNVQAAVDTTNHLIVAHEVTNVGTDKSQLANMANQAKAALEAESLEAWRSTAGTCAKFLPLRSTTGPKEPRRRCSCAHLRVRKHSLAMAGPEIRIMAVTMPSPGPIRYAP
jgi:transposase